MSDLISRQAAIDAFNTNIDELVVSEKENAEAVERYLNRVIDEIKQLPPIQPKPLQPWEVLVAQAVLPQPAEPQIIRCKDCKYAEYIDDVKTLWCTECGQGRTVAPYDFCSYGERREVTT